MLPIDSDLSSDVAVISGTEMIKKNKLEILWTVKHTTQDGRIIQNVLSSLDIIIAAPPRLLPCNFTAGYSLSLSLYILICSSSAVISNFNLCINIII